jgi:hypothetical protein
MARANKFERFMLHLINQERTERGLDPLRFDGNLNESSERHTNWMLRHDIFDHDGAGGTNATQRMKEAGYKLAGTWRTGENIALQSERGSSGMRDDVRDLHQSLMNSPSHRANILNPKFDEIGIGIERGSFRLGGNTFDAVAVTQDFGKTSAHSGARQVEMTKADPVDSFQFRDVSAPSAFSSETFVADIAPNVTDWAEWHSATQQGWDTSVTSDLFLF